MLKPLSAYSKLWEKKWIKGRACDYDYEIFKTIYVLETSLPSLSEIIKSKQDRISMIACRIKASFAGLHEKEASGRQRRRVI